MIDYIAAAAAAKLMSGFYVKSYEEKRNSNIKGTKIKIEEKSFMGLNWQMVGIHTKEQWKLESQGMSMTTGQSHLLRGPLKLQTINIPKARFSRSMS